MVAFPKIVATIKSEYEVTYRISKYFLVNTCNEGQHSNHFLKGKVIHQVNGLVGSSLGVH